MNRVITSRFPFHSTRVSRTLIGVYLSSLLRRSNYRGSLVILLLQLLVVPGSEVLLVPVYQVLEGLMVLFMEKVSSWFHLKSSFYSIYLNVLFFYLLLPCNVAKDNMLGVVLQYGEPVGDLRWVC